MSASKQKNKNSNSAEDQQVEVLYQKLGGQWYAFSMIDEDVFVAPVTDDKILEIRKESHETN